MKTWITALFVFLLSLASCGSGNADHKSSTGKTENKTSMDIKNGISIKENGLKVTQALLMKEDQTPLAEDNTVGIGDVILCRLFVSGWHEENGQVKLGAYEEIQTSGGETILKEEDLFKDMVSARAEDAKVVTLRATITKLTKSIRDFRVEFRVWDKVSNAEVTGSFPFHLK